VIAATVSADLIVGLVLGVFVGLLVGPVLRAWLSWREWTSASREADLFGDVLDRMDDAIAASPPRAVPDHRPEAHGVGA
jgi:hypothetical protein